VAHSSLRGSSDRSVLVLTSLASGPKHGYALIQDIRGFAGVTLGPGTLYGCLAKLEQSGLVEPLPADDRRRPYRITAAGKAALQAQLRDSQRIARVGLGRLGRLGGATA
jgi:DNA-binding PadR family transcriptional regulator